MNKNVKLIIFIIGLFVFFGGMVYNIISTLPWSYNESKILVNYILMTIGAILSITSFIMFIFYSPKN